MKLFLIFLIFVSFSLLISSKVVLPKKFKDTSIFSEISTEEKVTQTPHKISEDEVLLLTDVPSNLDFNANNSPAAADKFKDQLTLRDTRYWGRLYLNGWPQPIQYLQAHFGSNLLSLKHINFFYINENLCSISSDDLKYKKLIKKLSFYSNLVLLVKRGDCTYSKKARNALNLGSKGIIIINNEEGIEHLAGPDEKDIDIFVGSIGEKDGYLIQKYYDKILKNIYDKMEEKLLSFEENNSLNYILFSLLKYANKINESEIFANIDNENYLINLIKKLNENEDDQTDANNKDLFLDNKDNELIQLDNEDILEFHYKKKFFNQKLYEEQNLLDYFEEKFPLLLNSNNDNRIIYNSIIQSLLEDFDLFNSFNVNYLTGYVVPINCESHATGGVNGRCLPATRIERYFIDQLKYGGMIRIHPDKKNPKEIYGNYSSIFEEISLDENQFYKRKDFPIEYIPASFGIKLETFGSSSSSISTSIKDSKIIEERIKKNLSFEEFKYNKENSYLYNIILASSVDNTCNELNVKEEKVKNKFIIFKRQTPCNFYEKALLAQNSGAAGVIIVNNENHILPIVSFLL